jgi:hypothetical protein
MKILALYDSNTTKNTSIIAGICKFLEGTYEEYNIRYYTLEDSDLRGSDFILIFGYPTFEKLMSRKELWKDKYLLLPDLENLTDIP